MVCEFLSVACLKKCLMTDWRTALPQEKDRSTGSSRWGPGVCRLVEVQIPNGHGQLSLAVPGPVADLGVGAHEDAVHRLLHDVALQAEEDRLHVVVDRQNPAILAWPPESEPESCLKLSGSTRLGGACASTSSSWRAATACWLLARRRSDYTYICFMLILWTWTDMIRTKNRPWRVSPSCKGKHVLNINLCRHCTEAGSNCQALVFVQCLTHIDILILWCPEIISRLPIAFFKCTTWTVTKFKSLLGVDFTG